MKLHDSRCAEDPVPDLRPSRGASRTEKELYTRYVRALALLAECAPYVDEPDYEDLIEILLRDAEAHYPLTVCRNGARWEIAPR